MSVFDERYSIRRFAGCGLLSILVASSTASFSVAQLSSDPVGKVETELEESLREAAKAPDAFDRVEHYTSIRIPESMIEIALAGEHFDLVVRNRFITTLRASLLARSPEARAEAIVETLNALAKEGRVSPIESFSLEQGVLFVVADQPALALAHEDLDILAGETLEAKEAEVLANLELALAEMVELHDPRNLASGALKTLTASLIFVLVFWGLQRTKRVIDQKALPALDQRLRESIAKRIGESAKRELRFLKILRALLTALLWIVFLTVSYAWLAFSLEQFPYTRPWGESLGETLLELFWWLTDGAVRAIPGLFVVLLILFLARMVSRLVRGLFEAVEAGRIILPGLHPETAQPTRRIVNSLVWLVALVVAYPYFPGSSSAAFKGLSVFVGLVISLGSTGIVNQAMSGLMLMYARALRPGDFVRVGEVEGTVSDLGMLSTKVRSLLNEEVTVPNAVVISRETVNYSRFEDEGVAITTSVTIGYDTPWRTVHALLEAAAEKTPGLRHESKPRVLQTALSDHYPEYRLIAVIDRPKERGPVLSALHQNIQDLFHQNGIQIMSPHYVSDPEKPVIASTETS
jgi:small-conductance mechanosensitive channel